LLLKSFKLDSFQTRPFGRLAAGEKKLVLLARALIKRPKLVLLDEPTRGRHSAARRKVIRAAERVCRRTGSALVWVTHNPEEVPRGMTHWRSFETGE